MVLGGLHCIGELVQRIRIHGIQHIQLCKGNLSALPEFPSSLLHSNQELVDLLADKGTSIDKIINETPLLKVTKGTALIAGGLLGITSCLILKKFIILSTGEALIEHKQEMIDYFNKTQPSFNYSTSCKY